MRRILLFVMLLTLSLSVLSGVLQAVPVPQGVVEFGALHPKGAPGKGAGVAKPVGQAQPDLSDPEKITVYVTKTGTKYHREGCRYVSRSKIPMSLKSAAKRYAPCKVCRPPLLKS